MLKRMSLILLLCCSWAMAADRYVNGDGVCGGLSPCHTTITLAVAALDATPTTIHVQGAGPYDEHGLQLAATCANRTVVIDGDGASTIITNSDADAGVVLPKPAASAAAITISNCTIKMGSATSACVLLSGEAWPATSSLTLDHVTFDQDALSGGHAVTMMPNAAGGSVTLRDCTITDDAGGSTSIYVQYLSSLTCERVAFGSTGGNVAVYPYTNMGNIDLIDCTFSRTGQGFVDIRSGVPSASGAVIRMHNCTVSGTYLIRQLYGVGGTGNNYGTMIEDCTLTRYGTMSGISWGRDKPWSEHDYCGRLTMRGNTMSAHATATGAHAVLIGGGCDATVIEDNTIADAVAGANSYQIVSKARGTKIRGNRIYGPRSVYIVSGQGCVVEHNTIYSTVAAGTGQFALKWWTQDTTHASGSLTGATSATSVTLALAAKTEANGVADYWVGHIITIGAEKGIISAYNATSGVATLQTGGWAPWNIGGLSGTPAVDAAYTLAKFRSVTTDANVIQNNIIVASGLGNYCLSDGTPADGSKNNLIDCNIYYATGTAKLASIGGADKTTLDDDPTTGLIAAYAGVSAYNDAHSLMADPRLVNPTAGDFSLWGNSPAIGAGFPRWPSGTTTYGPTMGAWVPDPRRQYGSIGAYGTHGTSGRR
jgi:hypothetical protein